MNPITLVSEVLNRHRDLRIANNLNKGLDVAFIYL